MPDLHRFDLGPFQRSLYRLLWTSMVLYREHNKDIHIASRQAVNSTNGSESVIGNAPQMATGLKMATAIQLPEDPERRPKPCFDDHTWTNRAHRCVVELSACSSSSTSALTPPFPPSPPAPSFLKTKQNGRRPNPPQGRLQAWTGNQAFRKVGDPGVRMV